MPGDHSTRMKDVSMLVLHNNLKNVEKDRMGNMERRKLKTCEIWFINKV